MRFARLENIIGMKRDSHAMTEANWAALDRAAKAVGCASWRVMLRRIAAGELRVRVATPELDALGKALGASTARVTNSAVGERVEPVAITPDMKRALRVFERRNAQPIARPSEAKAKC